MTSTNATHVHYHAGHNMVGYLPESDVETFDNLAEAKSYAISELLFAADSTATWADEHDCDDIPCPTYGDDCPAQLASSLALAAEDVNLAGADGWSDIIGNNSWWITPCQDPYCQPDEEEPAEEPAPTTTARHLPDTHYCTTCTYRHTADHLLCPFRHDDDPRASAEGAADGATRPAEATPAPAAARSHLPGPWPKTPTMSRQDFAYLARVLADLDFLADDGKRGPGTVHGAVVEHFAYHLADTNARFDRERFVRAAEGGNV